MSKTGERKTRERKTGERRLEASRSMERRPEMERCKLVVSRWEPGVRRLAVAQVLGCTLQVLRRLQTAHRIFICSPNMPNMIDRQVLLLQNLY